MASVLIHNHILASQIFTVYAGPKHEKLSAHAGILIKSPALRKIVEGVWKDSQERVVKLEDHDFGTVSQMLEWLYCGYYSWGRACLPNAPPIESTCSNDREQLYIISQALDGSRLVTLSPLTSMENQQLQTNNNLTTLSRPSDILRHGQPGKRGTPLSTVTNHHKAGGIDSVIRFATRSGCVLVQDAKLYVLAQYLELSCLKDLTFRSIQEVLSDTMSDKQETNAALRANVVTLIRFVYDHTDSLTNSVEPLRRLVTSFVAVRYKAVKGPEFDLLLSEGGGFPVDLVAMMEVAAVSKISKPGNKK
ncbi:MAG: hypothetical protein Q9197_001855 [Variospora fuerteventurae]